MKKEEFILEINNRISSGKFQEDKKSLDLKAQRLGMEIRNDGSFGGNSGILEEEMTHSIIYLGRDSSGFYSYYYLPKPYWSLRDERNGYMAYPRTDRFIAAYGKADRLIDYYNEKIGNFRNYTRVLIPINSRDSNFINWINENPLEVKE